MVQRDSDICSGEAVDFLGFVPLFCAMCTQDELPTEYNAKQGDSQSQSQETGPARWGRAPLGESNLRCELFWLPAWKIGHWSRELMLFPSFLSMYTPWLRPGQWTGLPMCSPGQQCSKWVEARLIFKWTGLLMGSANRAKIGSINGPKPGQINGQALRPSLSFYSPSLPMSLTLSLSLSLSIWDPSL